MTVSVKKVERDVRQVQKVTYDRLAENDILGVSERTARFKGSLAMGFPPMGVVVGRGQVKKVPCSRCKSPFVTDRSKAEQICVTYNGACARAPHSYHPLLPPSTPCEACLPVSYNGKRKGSHHPVFNAILETDVLINGTRWRALCIPFSQIVLLFPRSLLQVRVSV